VEYLCAFDKTRRDPFAEYSIPIGARCGAGQHIAVTGQLLAFDIRKAEVLFLPEDPYTSQEDRRGEEDRHHED
jgi:hypothetical protein